MRRFCWPPGLVFCLLLALFVALASFLGEAAGKAWLFGLAVLVAMPVCAAVRPRRVASRTETTGSYQEQH